MTLSKLSSYSKTPEKSLKLRGEERGDSGASPAPILMQPFAGQVLGNCCQPRALKKGFKVGVLGAAGDSEHWTAITEDKAVRAQAEARGSPG